MYNTNITKPKCIVASIVIKWTVGHENYIHIDVTLNPMTHKM